MLRRFGSTRISATLRSPTGWIGACTLMGRAPYICKPDATAASGRNDRNAGPAGQGCDPVKVFGRRKSMVRRTALAVLAVLLMAAPGGAQVASADLASRWVDSIFGPFS